MPPDIMTPMLKTILPWILLFGMLSILATAFRVIVWPKLKGRLGEVSINFLARRFPMPCLNDRLSGHAAAVYALHTRSKHEVAEECSSPCIAMGSGRLRGLYRDSLAGVQADFLSLNTG